MKISIPEKIKSDIDTVEAVYLETAKANAGDCSPAFAGYLVSLKHIAAVDFVTLHNTIFENCTHIQYRVTYKNNIIEVFKFNSKQQAIYKSTMTLAAQQCVRHQTSELFEDTDEGRQGCLDELENKSIEAFMESSDVVGTKNLIYYTIYFDKGYVELLNKSIMSILDKSKANFDVLLITDEATKEKIESQPFIKKLTPKYLITNTPFDGVGASQCKTRVFEYVDINKYSNILFLDCDIICLKDVNTIFKKDIKTDVLYTARNLNLNYGHHRTFHHGFPCLNENHVFEMSQAKQMPFNAGQFLFKNSARMRKHFENVNWFMENWVGEYFFEQAFMNYYFCKAYATQDTILQQHMSVVSTTNIMEYTITNDTCLVHFIAPPLDAKTKLAFIEEFSKNYSKSYFKKATDKIKSIFKKSIKHHE